MVIIGELVVITDALTGEVRLRPKMNIPWLKIIPSNDAKAMLSRSRLLTSSFFVKRETVQNNTAAPSILNSVSNSGAIPEASTAFPTGALSPHIVSAPSIAPWPFISSVFILSEKSSLRDCLTAAPDRNAIWPAR